MTLPRQFFVESQRLRLSCWDWGNEAAPAFVLVHGGRDHARSWDRIAERLCADYHVVAFDLRGHGDSDWSPGGNYGLPDNALDLVRVVETAGSPAIVLGHSYGGAVTLVAAGTYPEHFRAVAILEGTHSLNPMAEEAMGPLWVRRWADRLRGFETSEPRVYADLEAAAERMLEANPRLPKEFVPHLAAYATKPVPGGLIWKYDLWVNGRTSMELRRDELPRFWEAVECPVLLVDAADSHTRRRQYPQPERHFRDPTTLHVEDSGHWIHHDQPDVLMQGLRDWLGDHGL